MTTLGDSMVKALFGQTDAEKTFRPWWDNLEDVLLYGLIILGKFLLILLDVSKYTKSTLRFWWLDFEYEIQFQHWYCIQHLLYQMLHLSAQFAKKRIVTLRLCLHNMSHTMAQMQLVPTTFGGLRNIVLSTEKLE